VVAAEHPLAVGEVLLKHGYGFADATGILVGRGEAAAHHKGVWVVAAQQSHVVGKQRFRDRDRLLPAVRQIVKDFDCIKPEPEKEPGQITFLRAGGG
jgi:hypothetical protein